MFPLQLATWSLLLLATKKTPPSPPLPSAADQFICGENHSRLLHCATPLVCWELPACCNTVEQFLRLLGFRLHSFGSGRLPVLEPLNIEMTISRFRTSFILAASILRHCVAALLACLWHFFARLWCFLNEKAVQYVTASTSLMRDSSCMPSFTCTREIKSSMSSSSMSSS